MLPAHRTKEELLEILRDITTSIESGDSFEGSIQFSCLDKDVPKGQFNVMACYRVGNLQGQGGVIMVGKMED